MKLLSAGLFFVMLLGRPGLARADMMDSGVVTAVGADHFEVKLDSGRVYALYPDEGVVRGHSSPLPSGGVPRGPSPQIPFAALRPGMRVVVEFHFDPKQHGRAICIMLVRAGAPPPKGLVIISEP